MKRDKVVRVCAGLFVACGLVLSTAGACGGDAPPPTETQKPADGIPNNGDGDADG